MKTENCESLATGQFGLIIEADDRARLYRQISQLMIKTRKIRIVI
jgi:hypothetical protein